VKPAPFELHRPRHLAEVLQLLSEHDGEVRLLAGGQSLVPMMNLRLVGFSHLVDLNRVADLAYVQVEGDNLRIGAMMRQQALLNDPLVARHAPLLAAALPNIGHVQTRSRGTLGGSLSHADPSAELPLVCVTLGATFQVRSQRGERSIAAADFFEDAMLTCLAADEVLTEVSLPIAPAGSRVAFREYARRHGDFAMASAAAQLSASGELRVGLGGVNSVPFVCADLGRELSRDRQQLARLDDLIAHEVSKLQAMSDIQADAEYRRVLAAVLLNDCLREVMQ
jgi:CO/xanthine dehydrogenase FAD-binding subunit